MWLIHAALHRPIAIIVAVIAIALCAILAVIRMPADIFPNLNLPVIYVAQPYGGMSPAQMEGYLTYYYEYHFLYINGIQNVESKSIQGAALLKLTFHPGTNMSQAESETIAYVNRARAFMPPGTVPPFIIRFDAGSVPVGYLVFSSTSRTLGEIQDLALNRVRPLFATLPGVSAPPPFGGNQRTVVITVSPERLRAYQISPEQIVAAVNSGNTIVPAGNMSTGSLWRITPSNATVSNIQDLLNIPLRTGVGPSVYLRDVGTVQNSTDILAGYALVNGRRAVYIPVTKRADASTLAVISEVKKNLARFQSVVPEDIRISLEFDQSSYVRNALSSVLREAALGALLTGFVVLLFLRDWRSALIVVTTIPFALLTAVVALWAAGQTINIMTLGGLALAVGILVDESTVVIESIHHHLSAGETRARAVLEASKGVVIPRLLAMLCVLAVFVPSFFMTGVPRALFVPLSLAVGLAMAASYFLSSSLVPVMSVWLLRHKEKVGSGSRTPFVDRMREKLGARLRRYAPHRRLILIGYSVLAFGVILLVGPLLGREIFPQVTGGQFQLRFRAPIGTRVDVTEQMALQILEQIGKVAGPANVQTTLGYVGTIPSTYPINTVFLWTSGPHEGVLRVALGPNSHISMNELKERLRKALTQQFPSAQFSFESGDIVSQIMNFGAPTPIEIAVAGANLATDRTYAEKVRTELSGIHALRDLQFEEPLDYPSLDVHINRELAGQLGVTVKQAGLALADATSSSRFVTPIYWADPTSGVAYQVQVEFPQPSMTNLQDLNNIPVMSGGAPHPLLGDIAQITPGTITGEYDRFNGQRMLSLTANVSGEDLGRAAKQVQQAIQRAGAQPRGVSVAVRGQIAPMKETLSDLGIGLLIAVVVVFLLLAASFQSMRLSLVVLSTIPTVIAGVILALLITDTTLNIQSFMGAIMAIGVSVANAILLVVSAEQNRKQQNSALDAAIHAAQSRMRPILMTSMAMVAGMIPMALALGAGAEETAPLGRAVIGGLLASTVSTLVILPFVFSFVQKNASASSASLDPDDPASAYASEASGPSNLPEGAI
ncbi:MAG TPA: efflux RND transporter permease subunit [Terriglobales bacterium]|nr:efflux RND transporter permease subunit [Terriglobales bacterium]